MRPQVLEAEVKYGVAYKKKVYCNDGINKIY